MLLWNTKYLKTAAVRKVICFKASQSVDLALFNSYTRKKVCLLFQNPPSFLFWNEQITELCQLNTVGNRKAFFLNMQNTITKIWLRCQMLRALVVSTSGAAKRRHPCTAESPNLKTLRFFFFFKQPWTHLYYCHTSFNYWLSSCQKEIEGIARRNNAFIHTKAFWGLGCRKF